MTTRRERQTALHEFCVEVLTQLRSGLKNNARMRDLPPGSGRAQRDLIGDPAYYLETMISAEGSVTTQETREHAATQVEEVYQVSLWLEYEDAESYSASSQSEYDKLAHDGDSAGPGLLKALLGEPEPAAPGHPDVSDWPKGLELGQPVSVEEPIVELDNQGRLAHLIRIQIPLTYTTL